MAQSGQDNMKRSGPLKFELENKILRVSLKQERKEEKFINIKGK
jgi:hypothetical protein